MSDDTSAIESIRANAALVREAAQKALGQELNDDATAVQWLDGFIQRQHEQGDRELWDGLVNTLGSYLGECVIRAYGGEWAELDGSWAVRFDNRNAVFPFTKVQKHLEDGGGDSVLSFFTLIPLIFPNCTKR